MNIALIDDHILLTEILQSALQLHIADADIKNFSGSSDFFAQNFKEWQPEIVLTDMLMPGMSGLELMDKALLELGAHYKFIILSSISDVHTIKNAIRMGARGYLSKDTPLEEVIEAITTVLQGEQYIGKSLRPSLVKYVFDDDKVTFHLSPREKEVLNRVCDGQTPKEIAYETGLSQHTVQEYLRSIMRKFKVNRTIDLVVFAIQKGLYNPPKK